MIKLAYKNYKRKLKSYIPYSLIILFFAFVFTTLLSLMVYSKLIYRKSGSEDLLAVFEDNRACPLASLVPESYRARLEDVPHIEDITGEVRHMIVYAPKKSLTIAGVEPHKFRDFKNIKIKDAEYEDFKNDKQGVIIGEKVQRDFNWRIGESINFQGLSFNVQGVFKLPLSIYNGMIVFHKDYLQELVKKKGYFTAFTIKIDSPLNKSEVSGAVERLFTDHPSGIVCRSEAEFWGRTEKQLGNFGKMMRALTAICAILIFALVANGSAFRLKNRHSEIRVMRAAGFSRAKIFNMLLLEPVFAALVPAVCGGLLAFFIWIMRPTIGGTQAILPPIAVTPPIVIASVLVISIIAVVSTAATAFKFSNG